ncbi:hypothetical protein RDABS01_032078, partial [Bienertia sinuspersici]
MDKKFFGLMLLLFFLFASVSTSKGFAVEMGIVRRLVTKRIGLMEAVIRTSSQNVYVKGLVKGLVTHPPSKKYE